MEPYGKKIATVKISGCEIDVFSNGACDFVSNDPLGDNEGQYLAMKYQCVEFVRRYVYLTDHVNLAAKWSDGDAKDWYKNRDIMGLESVNIDNAKVGDIITFTGGEWGHVAIISDINDKNMCICGQNFYNDISDVHMVVAENILSGNEGVFDATNHCFMFQSILRIAST